MRLHRSAGQMEDGKKPLKQQKRHSLFRRLLIFFGVFVIITMIIVLVVIFVAFPKLAQSGVNKTDLNIFELSMTDPTPDSFILTQKAIVTNPSAFHPWLAPMNVSLSLGSDDPAKPNKPWGYVTMPGFKAVAKYKLEMVNQKIKIIDLDAFTEFASATVMRENYTMVLDGETQLQVGVLHTNIKYHKVLPVKGLNALKGFRVAEDFTIAYVPNPDGSNLVGNAVIPNPSFLTVDMGNTSFTLHDPYDGKPIGYVTMENTTIKPGNNVLAMRTFANQKAILKAVKKSDNGTLTFGVTGNSSVFDGNHLEYFERAVEPLRLNATLNLADLKPVADVVDSDPSVISGSSGANSS